MSTVLTGDNIITLVHANRPDFHEGLQMALLLARRRRRRRRRCYCYCFMFVSETEAFYLSIVIKFQCR